MSDLNLQWLADNFSNQQTIIFDIGCADMNGDTARIRQMLPHAKIHAFECEERWFKINSEAAKHHNIVYHHLAVSDRPGQELFWPSLLFNGEPWGYSGNLAEVENNTGSDVLVWGEPYFVKTTSLNSFCTEHNIVPNFIHIDAEGSEYKIFANLDTKIRPKAIWSEITEYHDNKFDSLLHSYGYNKVYTDGNDAMYVLGNSDLSNYVSLTKEQKIELDYMILSNIWLKQYAVVRGETWPELKTAADFYLLPEWIKEECLSVFNLAPPTSYKSSVDD